MTGYASPAPKGAFRDKQLSACLKACPDTNRISDRNKALAVEGFQPCNTPSPRAAPWKRGPSGPRSKTQLITALAAVAPGLKPFEDAGSRAGAPAPQRWDEGRDVTSYVSTICSLLGDASYRRCSAVVRSTSGLLPEQDERSNITSLILQQLRGSLCYFG